MTSQPLNGNPQPPAQPQLQVPVECTPHHIPIAWSVQYNPATTEVAIVVIDATGQRWIVLDHESAARFGEDILRNAGLARTGLVIP